MGTHFELGRARLRIVLVEDVPEVGQCVASCLDDSDVEFTTTSGLSILEDVRKRGASAVLLNSSAGLQALEWCRALRLAGQTIPLLVFVRRLTEMERVVGTMFGSDGFLMKPVDPMQLRRVLYEAMRR